MKKFNLNKVSIIMLVVAFVFSLSGLNYAEAATSPALGATSTYGVVSETYTGNVAATNITGDVCYTTGPGTFAPVITGGSLFVPCTNGGDQTSALADINGQVLASCLSVGAGAVDLNAIDVGSGLGIFPPGCYTNGGDMNIAVNQSITLSGAGTYIFKPGGALTTQADTNVVLAAGAQACDVFWAPVGATTLGAYTGALPNPNTFVGTIFRGNAAGLSITLGHFGNLLGRALAFGSTVTTDANIITTPTCVVPPLPPVVIVGGAGLVVPPLISVLKVPNPLSLPLGPGLVAYDYMVSNLGTVAMNNIVVTDNMCFGINFISGDIDGDLMLDISETWNYRCSSTLTQTTTNTATATGQANGLTAIDTTNATVVVGVPLVPPLIHLVKTPNKFILPVGGGAVTYGYTVTNPGTAPLSNVSVIDDRCTGLPGRVFGHPGDLNQNNLLESNEAWSFICQTNITQTTTNTGTAQGSANGLTAIDFALATVVVAIPGLPDTGFPPKESNILVVVMSMFAISFIFYKIQRKNIA